MSHASNSGDSPRSPMPSHAICADTLASAGASLDASESHGLLCGLICAGASGVPAAWLGELFDAGPADFESLIAGNPDLGRLLAGTAAALDRREFGFEPLLPDDDSPLAARGAALGQWCGGFLYGLGLGGATERSMLGDDAEEFLADLAEITRVRDDTAAGEAGESNLVELVEYVRVGVLLVRDKLSAARDVPPPH